MESEVKRYFWPRIYTAIRVVCGLINNYEIVLFGETWCARGSEAS